MATQRKFKLWCWCYKTETFYYYTWHSTGDSGASVEIDGGPIIVCDRLEISPENAPFTPELFDRVEMLGTALPDITFTDERLRQFGIDVASLGSASVQAQNGHLVVANIGSSGEDGVECFLGSTMQDGPYVALATGVLLTLFALTMSLSLGVQSALAYSLPTAASAALLLATTDRPWCRACCGPTTPR